MNVDISYEASPTVAAFMKSEASFRMIAGPVGSGKTTGCIFELLRRASQQAPGRDGIRRTRFAIVRQTLQQLKMTVLKDIEEWLRGIVHWKVSDATIYVSVGDVRSEFLLIPLEDPEDQRRLLSSQLTGAWMSEAIEIDTSLIPPLQGRCGRYPGPADGGATWFGMIADTNMPTEGSDWHRLMAEETPSGWQIFYQPGGLSAGAENLDWLVQTPETLRLPQGHPERIAQGRLYYERLAAGHSADYIRRYVNAEFGADPSGSAVFRTTFNRAFHVSKEPIGVVPGSPLIVAQDFGRNPCALIGQLDPSGRLNVLDEVVSADMGLEQHVETKLRPKLMSERFIGKPCWVVGDPAGMARDSIYEQTCFDLLKAKGFRAFKAPTNDIDPRIRAVEALFLGARGAGPALMIDPACVMLTRALGGLYRYAKMKSGQLAPAPVKDHPHSDLADCLQYMALTAHGGYSGWVTAKLRPPPKSRPPPPVGGWT